MSYRGNTFNNSPTNPAYAANPYTRAVPSAYNSRGSGATILQRFERFSKKIEDLTDHPIVQKIVPYTPTIARFLIVATFFEDAVRIICQWPEQVYFLSTFRRFPTLFVVLFLGLVSLSMVIGATLVLLKKQTLYATSILCVCIVSQAIVYGLYSGSSFVLRNISVIGGLLITFGDSIVKKQITFGMLPELKSKDGRTKGYMLLTGRILIVVMFVTFTFSKNWLTVIITIAGTICIAVGYKTKFASMILCLILSLYNLTLNQYWTYRNPDRDFLKYEFYQNLNIIGGLLLVVNTGAGTISFDEKKKIY